MNVGINYIRFLTTLDYTPLLFSCRKMGYLGLIICDNNIMSLHSTYVDNEFPLLKYIISYKFTQDHLEIFFSVVRSKGGFNNNPTCW